MKSLEERVKWAERGDNSQNPLDFFRQHYDPSTTRGQLAKQDKGLYGRLREDGLLEHVPTSRAEKRDFGNNPIAYYKEHNAGLTRGKLKLIDSSLYRRLRKDGLLEYVPTSNRFGNDPLVYYQEHHAGLTRGKLKLIYPSFYERLRRDGLLKHIPTRSSKIG